MYSLSTVLNLTSVKRIAWGLCSLNAMISIIQSFLDLHRKADRYYISTLIPVFRNWKEIWLKACALRLSVFDVQFIMSASHLSWCSDACTPCMSTGCVYFPNKHLCDGAQHYRPIRYAFQFSLQLYFTTKAYFETLCECIEMHILSFGSQLWWLWNGCSPGTDANDSSDANTANSGIAFACLQAFCRRPLYIANDVLDLYILLLF